MQTARSIRITASRGNWASPVIWLLLLRPTVHVQAVPLSRARIRAAARHSTISRWLLISSLRQRVHSPSALFASGASIASAFVCIGEGQYDDAEREFKEELAENPDDLLALWKLGELLERNDPSAARRYLERSVRFNPQLRQASLAYGRTLEATGDPDKAIAQFQRVVTLATEAAICALPSRQNLSPAGRQPKRRPRDGEVSGAGAEQVESRPRHGAPYDRTRSRRPGKRASASVSAIAGAGSPVIRSIELESSRNARSFVRPKPAGLPIRWSNFMPKRALALAPMRQLAAFGQSSALPGRGDAESSPRAAGARTTKIERTLLVLGSLLLTPPLLAQGYVNSQLPWHKVVLDASGKLLAWYQPERNRGYDEVVRRAWDFVEHKVPIDVAAKPPVKVYLLHTLFDYRTLRGTNWWQHNPANVFAMFVDSVLAWYPYSGDREGIAAVREMLDYQLAHGTTPPSWDWARVPFASSCDGDPNYGRCLAAMPREFYGGIETDKVGELGLGYVLFYELTGDRKYLEAGRYCAEALARHVQPGDAQHTPWPFRVDGRTGEVLLGDDYGGMIVAPVRLFDELMRLQEGDTGRFRRARDLAWQWILKYPMNSESPAWDKWSGYFGDIGPDTNNLNQALPTITAYYILTRSDPASVDPVWVNHVGHLIDWVRGRFGRGPYFGAWGIDEQGRPEGRGCCSRAGLGSDTSRWGAINALYYERTGDAQAREEAFRALNYATYFSDAEGRVSCCGRGAFGLEPGGEYEFDDGYGDYIRNFLWAMGAVPEFAPSGENHILRSSSVVQSVIYGPRSVAYRTFDGAAVEVLRLNFRPLRVTAAGRSLAERRDLAAEGYMIRALSGGDFAVYVRHVGSREISLSGK